MKVTPGAIAADIVYGIDSNKVLCKTDKEGQNMKVVFFVTDVLPHEPPWYQKESCIFIHW